MSLKNEHFQYLLKRYSDNKRWDESGWISPEFADEIGALLKENAELIAGYQKEIADLKKEVEHLVAYSQEDRRTRA